MSKPKPYCAGTMTEAQFRSRIINCLRKLSMFWKPKSVALARARAERIENPATGKPKQSFKCEKTGKIGWATDMDIDHIDSVVPTQWGDTTEFLGYNWNEYLKRMFVEAEGYQVLAKDEHKKKSKKENRVRKSA